MTSPIVKPHLDVKIYANLMGSIFCTFRPRLVRKELEPANLLQINQNLETLMTDLGAVQPWRDGTKNTLMNSKRRRRATRAKRTIHHSIS